MAVQLVVAAVVLVLVVFNVRAGLVLGQREADRSGVGSSGNPFSTVFLLGGLGFSRCQVLQQGIAEFIYSWFFMISCLAHFIIVHSSSYS